MSEKLQYQTGASPLKSASDPIHIHACVRIIEAEAMGTHRVCGSFEKLSFIVSIEFLLSKEIRSACFLRSLIYRNSI